MFALWYGTIFYSQYKNILLEKIRKKSEHTDEPPKAAGPPSRIPVVDPKGFRPVSPQPPSSSTVILPPKPISPTPPKVEPPKPQPVPVKVPEPPKASEPVKLEPPAKPPRSPSPHPLRTDAFEEIEYEEDVEEEEEEEGSTDGEENSVISSSPRKNQLNSSFNEQRHKN